MTLSWTLRIVALCMLSGAVFIAPMPLGTNRSWAWSPMAILVGISLVFLSISVALGRAELSKAQVKALILPALATIIALLWGAMQILPLWGGAGAQLLFKDLAGALNIPAPERMVLDSERAIAGLMLLLAYSGIFLLSVQLFASSRSASLLCTLVVASATIVTIYGLIMQATTRSCLVLAFVKRPLESGDPCAFSGTFINSANYATYAGIASLICIAKLHDLTMRHRPSAPGASDTLRIWMSALLGRGGLYLAALVLLAGGVVFSASRAGFTSFVIGSTVMIGALALLRTRKPASVLISMISIGAFFAFILAVNGSGLLKRAVAALSEGDADRIALYSLSISAIKARPVTGWGLGSFEAVYSLLQPPNISLWYDRAHNIYLETALDLGIPAAFLLLFAVAFLLSRCVLGVMNRRRNAHYPAIGIGATVLVGFHGLLNFDLQIPAIAITFFALLGMAWAQAWSKNETEASRAVAARALE